jgi:hypothetical protein
MGVISQEQIDAVMSGLIPAGSADEDAADDADEE